MIIKALPESEQEIFKQLQEEDTMVVYINPNTNQGIYIHDVKTGFQRYDVGFWINSDFHPIKYRLSLSEAFAAFKHMALSDKVYQLGDKLDI